jgi:HEAT repeat protein
METDRLAKLIADLDHPDKPTIRAAVDQLIELAMNSEPVSKALEQRLNQTGHRNYWPVAYILGHLPQPSRAAIQKLLDALDHREPDIRWACLLLLVRIAKHQHEVITALLELCRLGAVNQRRMAIYGLRDLALSDSESLQAFIGGLSDSDATVRVAATTSLKARSDVNQAVREALLASYLNDNDLRVRNAVAVTLASMGAPAEEFLLALRKASKSETGQTKKAAEAALALLEK